MKELYVHSFPCFVKGPDLRICPSQHYTVETKIVWWGPKGLFRCGFTKHNMISSCGKGGEAPGRSVSNMGGKNQISLDMFPSAPWLLPTAHFKSAGLKHEVSSMDRSSAEKLNADWRVFSEKVSSVS